MLDLILHRFAVAGRRTARAARTRFVPWVRTKCIPWVRARRLRTLVAGGVAAGIVIGLPLLALVLGGEPPRGDARVSLDVTAEPHPGRATPATGPTTRPTTQPATQPAAEEVLYDPTAA